MKLCKSAGKKIPVECKISQISNNFYKGVGKRRPIIRGWSDKYLAYKRKTKILEKLRFISQHSLLLARYT